MDERSSTTPTERSAPALAPAPASAKPMAKPAAPSQREESNIKETIESILVAFILAFIFRAFIVEAFVIPTGSMAPTLLGAHLRFTCDDCGYRFDTNYSARANDPDGNPVIPNRTGPVPGRDPRTNRPALVSVIHHVNCPNCGYQVPRSQGTDVAVHYGDRILVLKYLYLFQDPQRWDVVVFKSPFDAPSYQQNYIKRLVGRPNESILILDGDVYVAEGEARDIEQFQVQTKPRHVQEALWRVVYDNDYHPRGLTRQEGTWEQPWKARDGVGWSLENDEPGAMARTFIFDNPAGGGTIEFDPNANRASSRSQDWHAFSDWLAYDAEERRWTPAVVGDLMVKLDYARFAGDGPLRLRLTKGEHVFTAEISPGTAKLFMKTTGGDEAEIASASLPDRGASPLRLEFANVDYRVTLHVNGQELLRATPQQYRPDTRSLLEMFQKRQSPPMPAVEITAERQSCVLTHLSLWRDVYYLNRGERYESSTPYWASPTDFPHNVIHLGPQDYFVLGDNSLMSLDARAWAQDIELDDLHVEAGRVPDRFMLGKAFFVYWPAGYRPTAFERVPAITPNFGDMRFIQ